MHGLFSGKSSSGSPTDPQEHATADAASSDLGYRQQILRADNRRSARELREGGLCCGGFLEPLLLTAEGARERLSVQKVLHGTFDLFFD